MIGFRAYFYTSIAFFIVSQSVQSQSISYREDRKRIILEEIKPAETKPVFKHKEVKSKTVNNDDILSISKRYKSGGVEFDSKYNTEALELTMQDLNLLKIDSLTAAKTVLSGGKTFLSPITKTDLLHDKLSQKYRLQGLMMNATLGGFNLSGWSKKKLSKKSKDILINIYGIEVIEE